MGKRIVELFLTVSDMDASKPFYEEVIGLDGTDHDTTVRFETGTATLVLREDFSPDVLAEYGLDEPVSPRGDGATIVLEVADPDAVYDRAEARDCDVLTVPRNVEWGRRMTLLRDPDGYVLEVSKPIDE